MAKKQRKHVHKLSKKREPVLSRTISRGGAFQHPALVKLGEEICANYENSAWEARLDVQKRNLAIWNAQIEKEKARIEREQREFITAHEAAHAKLNADMVWNRAVDVTEHLQELTDAWVCPAMDSCAEAIMELEEENYHAHLQGLRMTSEESYLA